MKIKDQTKSELEELNPEDLLKVYDLILSLKRRPEESKRKSGVYLYKGVDGR